MVRLLERSRRPHASRSALSPRLKSLLQKRQLAAGREKLHARLERIQEIAPTAATESNA